MTIALIVNMIYWPLLHEKMLIEKRSLNAPIYVFHLYDQHLVPIIVSAINLFITDVVFVRNNSKIFFSIGLVYLFLNWFAQQMRGTPVYWFMDWEQWETYLFAVFQLVMAPAYHLMMVFVTRRVKDRPLAKAKSI
mmetsp:Transcript_42469/g.31110  ORF Transcript_42469/g.31110 Transcript_42469/m.31110 type:complete len:135 (-) Transcript_42469:36-440(-)|eukprot:CAMPEP_0202960960 /NCGR_PEP_ID=MMETSP1396-20130829/5079_1 /ASSEMBLY_ACC=CAM_ASM_000872 /TAXON_ID= /ORGANISM="Pseudokeronopsis sp., Strain Brazil" /LENGTH=134 /DNA_ID=CAMNT_0049680495 /DNA_START=307 /DNA_END=711 /DNA_ORIENTATION=+